MNKIEPFIPKKSFGQNFLIQPSVIERIINACNLKSTDTVLEIGPGKGALTQALSPSVKKVIAIEKDKKLIKPLEDMFNNTNVQIIQADILKYNFDLLPNNLRIVANLPYNIATPIITKIIQHKKKFKDLLITIQLEYGQRIIAKPNTKNYGSFSCFVQFYTDPKILFKIKSSSFRPVPKVQSCFAQMNFRKELKYKVKDQQLLFKIIRACFGQRRKKIQNSLSGIMYKEKTLELLKALNIDPKLRAENLSLKDYVQITNLAAT